MDGGIDLDERLGRQRMLASPYPPSPSSRWSSVPALLDADVDEDRLVLERVEERPLIEVLRDPSVVDVEPLLHAVGQAVRHLRSGRNPWGLVDDNIMIVMTEAWCSSTSGLRRIRP